MNCILIHLTLPLFEHVTCMQMTPFLSALRKGVVCGCVWGGCVCVCGGVLEFIDAIVWSKTQSAEVMGLRALLRLNSGLNMAGP